MNARQDMHVHSTFSDGRDPIEDNVAEAEALGLTALDCVDHVRADTDWVPDYVAAVRRIRARPRSSCAAGSRPSCSTPPARSTCPTASTASTRSTPPTTRCRSPTGRPTRARCASGSSAAS